MKYRVIAHDGFFHLEQSRWYGWEYVKGYGDKDQALHALSFYVNHEREQREKKRKIVIAQEKV